MAEFERNLILERTKAGLAAARARGRLGGRRQALSPEKQRMVYELYQSKQHPIKNICDMFGISKPTLYKYVKAIDATTPKP